MIFWQGNPESIAADVKRIMGVCKKGGGYIFNTGEMNPRQVTEENMSAYMETALKLGADHAINATKENVSQPIFQVTMVSNPAEKL